MVRVHGSGALLVVLLLSGCGHKRSIPYPFRAPVLTSVHAPELRSQRRARREPEPRQIAHRTVRRKATTPEPARKPIRLSVPAKPLDAEEGVSLASVLRGMVGERDAERSDVEFALSAVRILGAQFDPEVSRLRAGRPLVTLAKRRGALFEEGRPLLGDLVVFDRVVGGRAASLVGVVVSSDNLGTVEFVYLARGVVRRGYVTPTRPSTKRDAFGHALNTHVRHSDGRDPRGTRYLAGELFAGVIRLDRLLPE